MSATITPLQAVTPAIVLEGDDFVRIVPRELTTELVDAAEAYRQSTLDAARQLPETNRAQLDAIVARRQALVQRKWDDLTELVSIEFRDRQTATAFIMSFAHALDTVFPPLPTQPITDRPQA
jgi:hypothetical protein